jgi:xylan 1,4-beta-xylosidase
MIKKNNIQLSPDQSTQTIQKKKNLFKMKQPGIILIKSLLCFCCFGIISGCSDRKEEKSLTTFCNPLDLNYRYQPDAPSRREAADPSMVLFKDNYFLFVSKTGGYWWSEDLKNWNLVETNEIPVEDYAPTAVVIGDTIYLMASSTEVRPIYKSSDPLSGRWQVARDTFPFPVWDPALFLDGNHLYLYWGCSNVNPIYGIELDYDNDFEPIGKPVICLAGQTDQHGWERPGDTNELSRAPWIEGAWMNKLNGKYYLQYAAPGTEFKSYADGVYISDNPLGPFHYASHNPFSLKAGGFSCGAGHGSTFSDKFGNLWHIATTTISVNHPFERRLALFPAMLDNDSILYTCTSFGDYPYSIPGYKFSDPNDLFTGWMLLSYKKPVSVSSSLKEFPPANAVDEDIRSFWSAETGSRGEWISIDLKELYEIKAIQVNYTDYQSDNYLRDSSCYYQYLIEWSADGANWEILSDKRKSHDDSPHLYLQLKKPISARFIKLTNGHIPGGHFAISGFRIFGKGTSEKPSVVNKLYITRNNNDRTGATLSWNKVPDATGYNIRYGSDREKLYSCHMVYSDTSLILRSLNTNQKYFFAIDAFNEGGITYSEIVHESE